MGYDLHVVRTPDWLDAWDAPITLPEVEALVAADPELSWSDADYHWPRDQFGTHQQSFAIVWQSASCFWWDGNQIVCKNPDPGQQAKLVQIAAALQAFAVGDDGEHYRTEVDRSGNTIVVATHDV